ncbi:Rhs family protein [Motilimonas pumila]|uniref:Rhs family protein n=2 Tax=Motilimonas pumila TaxID=2303987 RepID=A0A418YDF3_9GAMM|nr:Rhs family protein [Motilimonas pumila]
MNLDSYYQDIRQAFCSSIDDYKKDMTSWWKSWVLEMDQRIIVNNKERASASYDSNELETDFVTCPLNGKLHIVHNFETEEFVPIANTPFKIQAFRVEYVEVEAGYGATKRMQKVAKYHDIGPAYSGQVDANGIKEVQLDPATYGGKPLRITFEPDVTDQDMANLLASYDGTIDKLANWLDSEWQIQKQDWQDYLDNGIDMSKEVIKFFDNMIDAVLDAWDEIKGLFELLANPSKLKKLLMQYTDADKIEQMMASAKQEMADLLTLLKDEARCFLCINAIYSWCKLLSPAQLFDIASKTLAAILVEVVISLLIPGGAIIKNLNRLRDAASVAAVIN